MTGRKLVTSLVVVLLLIGATPLATLAQGGSSPQPILLDQETTPVGDVTVDGQQYSIYQQENVFPWASGIGVYADGERVTSSSTAEEAITAVAQRRAVQELGAEELSALRATSQNASATTPDVATAATSINETLAHLERMKTVRANGTTVYNASVDAAPQIPQFTQNARNVLPKFRSFENDATAYRSNATELAELLEQRMNGTDVDPQRLYAQYEATLEAKGELAEHIGFYGIDALLPELANMSDTIATGVASVPERGNETAQHFRRVHNESAVAATGVDGLALSEFEFSEAQNRADSLESEWMEAWNSRQSPASTVYQSLAGIVVGLAAVGGLVSWRRR